jgi:hypothetical protein
VGLLLGLAAVPAAAQDPPGSELRIYLATYGQGGAVWELFGHNALWVQDARTGATLSYNWGSFSFKEADFVPRLIRGSMRYWLAVADAEQEVAEYRYWDRSITVQELDLTPAQKLELQRFTHWNSLPENRYYDYHYFRDNCSTRVRDALDRVLGGELGRQLKATRSEETFRSHSLRLTARAPLTYTGIELGLADSADHLLTAWEEAFIPMELMRSVRGVRVSSPAGGTRSLVLNEAKLYEGSRPAPLESAPNRVPFYLLAGVLLAMFFTLLARVSTLLSDRRGRSGTSRWSGVARWALALSGGVWSLLVGFFGLLVLLLWAGTGHAFTYGNENLLQVNPLPLLLAVLFPLGVLRGGAAGRVAKVTALVAAAVSLLGLLLKPVPGFDQVNHDIMALMIPAHLGVLFALLLALYRPSDRIRPSERTPGPAVRGRRG